MKILIAMLLVFASSSCVAAQDGKQPVCKNQQMPADRVAVAEFQSESCTPAETNNAWDTVIPKDGTITCEERSIDSTARVLELESCERVQSESCPARLDGTKNAVVLRSPKSCLAKNGPGLRVSCYTDWTFKDWKHLIPPPWLHDAIVGSIVSPKCADPKNPHLIGNAFLIRQRSGVRVPDKTCWYEKFEDAEFDVLFEVLGDTDVIVRRFHSDSCNILVGAPTLNTVMVMKIDERPSRDLMMCDGTKMSTPPEQPPGWNNKKFIYYSPEELQKLYTPLCGIDDTKKPNATRLVNPRHDHDDLDNW